MVQEEAPARSPWGWGVGAGACLLLALATDLGPSLQVLLRGSAPPVPWTWAALPLLVGHLLAHRLRARLRWAQWLERAAWVLWWVALPLLAADLLGPQAGRRWAWLLLVGGGETLGALVAWRWVRDAARRRRDPLGLTLGRSPGWLGDQVRLPGPDRFLHLWVLGPTGSGKTRSVLLPAIASDLAAGAGLTVLDPKGDLALGVEELCQRLGRPYALLRPGDSASVHLNPLEGPPHQVAEAMVYALDRAFPDSHPFYRPLGQTLLRHSVQALGMARPPSQLPDLVRFLTDDTFRLAVLAQVEDPVLRAYFRDVVHAWSERQRQEYVQGVLNPLLALLGEPGVREVLTGKATFSWEVHLAQGGVLVAHLPVGQLGTAAQTLAAFLLSSFQQAALRRPSPLPAHFLYVDEFGSVAPGGFGELLALARAYGVGAVLAHQHLAQVPPDVLAAQEANVRSRLVLGGISAEDAWRVAASAATEEQERRRWAQRMRFAPRGEATALLTVDGQVRPPVTVVLPRPGWERRVGRDHG